MQEQTPYSRRSSSRIATTGAVYVCWGSDGYDDTSQVRDLGSGGLFVLTRQSKAMGAKTNLHFLVEEGQIRAEAIVRHVKPGRGLGLKFTAVREEDRRHLADLMKRLRGFGLISRFPSGELTSKLLCIDAASQEPGSAPNANAPFIEQTGASL